MFGGFVFHVLVKFVFTCSLVCYVCGLLSYSRLGFEIYLKVSMFIVVVTNDNAALVNLVVDLWNMMFTFHLSGFLSFVCKEYVGQWSYSWSLVSCIWS